MGISLNKSERWLVTDTVQMKCCCGWLEEACIHAEYISLQVCGRYLLTGEWSPCFGGVYDTGCSDDCIVQQTKLWRTSMSFAPSWGVQPPSDAAAKPRVVFDGFNCFFFFLEMGSTQQTTEGESRTRWPFCGFNGSIQWWAHSSAEKLWRIIFRSYLMCQKAQSCGCRLWNPVVICLLPQADAAAPQPDFAPMTVSNHAAHACRTRVQMGWVWIRSLIQLRTHYLFWSEFKM